jgi:pyruvate-formate lyase-activating enzyme
MIYNDYKNKIDKIDEELSSLSPTFCLARWFDSLMYFQTGLVSGCCKTQVNSMKLSSDTPSDLHNTDYQKMQRLLMLKGAWPKDCGYCSSIEGIEGGLSDRKYINAKLYDEKIATTYQKLKPSQNVIPRQLELSFTNKCNLACSYCSPLLSSRIYSEMEKYGDFIGSDERTTQLNLLIKDEKNPYLEQFYRWLPDLAQEVRYLKFTGGEPLLSEDVYKTLDYIVENSSTFNLESIGFNTNLSIKEDIFERFKAYISKIYSKEIASDVSVYASIDSWGEQAEYSRFGLDINLFEKNLVSLLEEYPEIKIYLTSTLNIFSLSSYRELLEKLLEIRGRFPHKNQSSLRLEMISSYLTAPNYLSCLIATDDLIDTYKKNLDFMNKLEGSEKNLFSVFEIDREKRNLAWINDNKEYEAKILDRSNFYSFICEYDKRRNLNFLKIFPEYQYFYSACRDAQSGK